MSISLASKKNIKTKYEENGINKFWFDTFVVPNVRRIKGNKCEICNSKEKLEVHHTNYQNINIHNLKLLCKSCHLQEHKKLREKGIIIEGGINRKYKKYYK